LAEAERKARELGIDLKIPALAPCFVDVCDEDPTRNLFVSVDGEVAPCVYLYPPVPSPINRIFCDMPASLDKLTFGNIFLEPLEQIWERDDYVAFRGRFAARRRKHELATSVAAALIASNVPLDVVEGAMLDEAPSPCRTCHRMLGL
jgi:MoaA/NifB/PqqE/SkfB family radical SAM enzyme